jgi:hypothetical protein
MFSASMASARPPFRASCTGNAVAVVRIVPLAAGPVIILRGHFLGDGAGDGQARGVAVGEERAGLLVLHLVLVIHVRENLERRLREVMAAPLRRRDDANHRDEQAEEQVLQVHSSSPM